MRVPIWISNRHLHLSRIDADRLFGEWYEFKVLKELSQPWQFACEEVVTLRWPKGEIKNVRILWPMRKQTQIEISISDWFALGVKAPVKLSGDLDWSEWVTISGPQGEVSIERWLIVAKRHLHITKPEADAWWLTDNQSIKVHVPSSERWLIFDNVIVRVSDKSALDLHIDVEEANASGLKNGDRGEII
jgi:putative phosphotransacetylase